MYRTVLHARERGPEDTAALAGHTGLHTAPGPQRGPHSPLAARPPSLTHNQPQPISWRPQGPPSVPGLPLSTPHCCGPLESWTSATTSLTQGSRLAHPWLCLQLSECWSLALCLSQGRCSPNLSILPFFRYLLSTSHVPALSGPMGGDDVLASMVLLL